MDKAPERILTGLVSALGVIGVMATIHSISDPSLRLWYAGIAFAAIAIAALLMVPGAWPSLKAIPNRQSLKPLDEELGDAKEVLISMHTGSVKHADGNLLKTRRKLRVVLTDPDSPALTEVAKIVHRSAKEMANDIRGITARLKETGNEVRWFDGPISNSLVITDPSLPSSWARVEVLLPFLEPTERPSLKASASRNPAFVARAKSAFEYLWDKSSPQ